jgi:glycosyltransferase 2 family protein
MTTPHRSRRIRFLVSLLFGAAALLFLSLAFSETLGRAQESVLPALPALVGAGLVVVGSMVSAAGAWVALFEGAGSVWALTGAFYLGSLGKYIPGGVWQAAAQVGLSRTGRVDVRRAIVAFPVNAITQVVAGAVIGSALAFTGSELPPLLRALSGLGVLLLPLLRRRWMLWLTEHLGTVLGRNWPGTLVPSQGAIVRAFGWNALALGLSGLSFAILLSSLEAGSPAAVPAFALAWTLGFIAIPFPAGIGIREAVLIWILGGGSRTALVIAASISQRLVAMAGDGLLVLLSRWHSGHPHEPPQLGDSQD